MTHQRDPVLGLPRDVILLGHLFGRLAHRLAGRRLGDRGRYRNQITGPDSGEGPEPLTQRLGPARGHQDLAHPSGVENRDVGEDLDPARDDHLGMSEQDLIGGRGHGLSGGGAGPVQGVRRYGLRKLREQTHLAGHVRRQYGGHHLAEDDLIDVATVEPGPGQQLAGGEPGEGDRGGVFQHGAGPGKRRAQARDDHGLAVTRKGHRLLSSEGEHAADARPTARCRPARRLRGRGRSRAGATRPASSPIRSRCSSLTGPHPSCRWISRKVSSRRTPPGPTRSIILAHPRSIEIVEQEDRVEGAEVGPGLLEVGLDPLDRE